ncbi:MAG: NADH-quinone oxidoreductase subunit H [Endomicrobia bacterium]|nr:NADH-quinone oxidoreductase subunit H [Endomicrobiia bacterium]
MIVAFKSLFYYLIFPGLLFSTFFAMLIAWIDRKLTARLQWRQGPPILQNFYDVLKLFGKEVIIPESAQRWLFVLAPFVAFSVATLVATIMWLIIFLPHYSFIGDIIVVIYLLTIIPVMYILGAAASKNVIASIGISREIKLLLAYELPLITALMVPMIKSSSIKFAEIMNTSVVSSISGIISLIVVILCFSAKLGTVPFDISEAETELAGGIFIEYSGLLLGFVKLTKQLILSVTPLFIIITYFSKLPWYSLLLVYIIILMIFTLIRNTNPRLKIDQVIKFFWFGMFPLSLFSVILTLIGR